MKKNYAKVTKCLFAPDSEGHGEKAQSNSPIEGASNGTLYEQKFKEMCENIKYSLCLEFPS